MAEPWALRHKALKKKVYTALVEGKNLRRASCLHALSRPEVGHLRAIAPRTPVCLVPNGVDLRPFDDLPPRSALEAEFPELAGKFVLLFFGRLHAKKGLDLLAEALGDRRAATTPTSTSCSPATTTAPWRRSCDRAEARGRRRPDHAWSATSRASGPGRSGPRPTPSSCRATAKGSAWRSSKPSPAGSRPDHDRLPLPRAGRGRGRDRRRADRGGRDRRAPRPARAIARASATSSPGTAGRWSRPDTPGIARPTGWPRSTMGRRRRARRPRRSRTPEGLLNASRDTDRRPIYRSIANRTDRPTSRPAKVSVIVPVKNEAENLRRCLPALAWADEVFVVDSQSTDETARVAAEHGASVVQFHFNGTYPKKKNWALDNLPFRNEWVLIVDADEVVVPELAEEIARRTAADEADGFYLNMKYFFLGRRIKPLRLCRGLEPPPLQAPARPLRADAGRPRRRRPATTRPTSTSSSTAGRSGWPHELDHHAYPTDRRLGREAQPLRGLGGRDVRAVPPRADPVVDRAGEAVQAAAQEGLPPPADAPAGPVPLRLRRSASGSSTAGPGWSSARSWRSTTSWPGRTSTSDRSRLRCRWTSLGKASSSRPPAPRPLAASGPMIRLASPES